MGVITVSIDDEVERLLRVKAQEKFGKAKGRLGKAITEAIKMWLAKEGGGSVEERQLELLKCGFDMGGLTVEAKKLREEIYATR
jgi:hypothetical protein